MTEEEWLSISPKLFQSPMYLTGYNDGAFSKFKVNTQTYSPMGLLDGSDYKWIALGSNFHDDPEDALRVVNILNLLNPTRPTPT